MYIEPVGDTALYNLKPSNNPLVNQGRRLWRLFDQHSFLLTEQMRQAGEENQQFSEEIQHLGDGSFSHGDWRHSWSTRNLDTLPAEERAEFEESAVLLAALKDDLHAFNERKIRQLNTPIHCIEAQNSSSVAASASEQTADGLVNTLKLARNCRVMLTRNLWPQYKLVNGARGSVCKIVYTPQNTTSVPDLVLVKFDSFTGPSALRDMPGVVALCPVTATWTTRGGQGSHRRTQLPLIPGFGFTIHKSQGMTLDKVIINLGPREFSHGLTYTAVSRVRSLNSLAFSPFPNFERYFDPLIQLIDTCIKSIGLTSVKILQAFMPGEERRRERRCWQRDFSCPCNQIRSD